VQLLIEPAVQCSGSVRGRLSIESISTVDQDEKVSDFNAGRRTTMRLITKCMGDYRYRTAERDCTFCIHVNPK
jgi:hypothetical protein